MTTRTLAAIAAALPDDTSLDRRSLLASAGAAAVLAAIGTPAAGSAINPDVALLALREPYERTLALTDHFSPAHSRAEAAYFALQSAEPASSERELRKRSGLIVAKRAYDRATNANLKVIDRIAETPAHTLDGVIFKAQVSQRESNMDTDLLASIVSDLVSLGTAPGAPPRLLGSA